MGRFTNCPSCSAPAEGQFCAYCGTPLFTTGDVVNDMQGKRCHIWFENDDGSIECLDVLVRQVDIENDITDLYSDSSLYMSFVTSQNIVIDAALMDFDEDDWRDLIEWQKSRYFRERS